MNYDNLSNAMKDKWANHYDEYVEALHTAERYKNCEGKHQLYDHEQFKQYHLDYQRKFREENPEYYNNYWKKKRLPGRIKKLEDKLNNPEWLSKRRKVDIDGSMIKLNELKELYKEQYGEEYHG